MELIKSLEQYGLNKAIDAIYKDPEKNLRMIMDWADRFAGEDFAPARKVIRQVIEDPDHPYHKFILRIIKDVDPEVAKTIGGNFFLNAVLAGWKKEEKLRKELDCNIPWAILLDPTSACNLHCTGCWAAEYGNKLNLSLEEIDSIVNQGRELGVYFYIYTGGEPLVRKKDIITLCERHPDCVFLSFTNGTLIDEAFADEMLRVKNFVPAISLEGFEAATDGRRGSGVYQKVVKAVNLLHRKRLVYGISCCYTRANFDSITSKEYLDSLRDMGVFFAWFFHYMPVGNDAVPELLPTPEQRTETMRRLREYRRDNPLFILDFQNDGTYVNGCIAGGKRYLHINANGDVDPCVFVHYSDSNIREKTLLQALQSPLFMQYHKNMPFNKNLLKPCPMLENPEKLPAMVKASGAKSTDLQSPETTEHLYAKTAPYAREWDKVADELWEEVKR